MKDHHKPDPLVVSRTTAARMLDVGTDFVDDVLIPSGALQKVRLGPRKVGVTWASLKAFVDRGTQIEAA